MNIASGLAARIFCICGSAEVTPRGTISSATTWMPDFSRPERKNLASSWPRSELSLISATRFRFLARACDRSVAIWIEPSGPVCQKYGLASCVVSVSPEFIGVICGVFASSVTFCCCWVAGVSVMLRMKTAPASTSFRAMVAEMSGRPWSSSIRSSILRPSTPPLLLISWAPNRMPSSVGSEYGLAGPTLSVITPILIVSCGKIAPAYSARTTARILFMHPSSVEQSLLVHPSYTKFHRLPQQLGLPLVVVRRALDHAEGLVAAAGGVMDDARVRLRHRVIGRILDRQQRHADRARAARPIGVRVVDRPLREPRAQGREAPEADRPVVRRGGLAHVAPAGLAVVGVDRGVEEAQVGHGAVGDEAALHLVAALQLRQHLLDPRGPAPHPFQLLFPEQGNEVRRVRRLVRAARIVDVELDVP